MRPVSQSLSGPQWLSFPGAGPTMATCPVYKAGHLSSPKAGHLSSPQDWVPQQSQGWTPQQSQGWIPQHLQSGCGRLEFPGGPVLPSPGRNLRTACSSVREGICRAAAQGQIISGQISLGQISSGARGRPCKQKGRNPPPSPGPFIWRRCHPQSAESSSIHDHHQDRSLRQAPYSGDFNLWQVYIKTN